MESGKGIWGTEEHGCLLLSPELKGPEDTWASGGSWDMEGLLRTCACLGALVLQLLPVMGK